MRTEQEIRERLAGLESRISEERQEAERCHKEAERAADLEDWDTEEEWWSSARCYEDAAASIKKFVDVYKWVLSED